MSASVAFTRVLITLHDHEEVQGGHHDKGTRLSTVNYELVGRNLLKMTRFEFRSDPESETSAPSVVRVSSSKILDFASLWIFVTF